MRNRLLAVLPIAALTAFGAMAPVNAGIAAPLHAEAPGTTTDMVELVGARFGYWNGYRGYHSYRHGYNRGPDGYWYPWKAFDNNRRYTGSIRREHSLRHACDLGFRPTNGPQNCNY